MHGADGLAGSTRGPFLDWASMAFGDGERRGRKEKITRHPPIGQCYQVQWPLCLCRDEMVEVGGEVPVISRHGWPPTGFAGAHYPPVIGLGVRATRPSA